MIIELPTFEKLREGVKSLLIEGGGFLVERDIDLGVCSTFSIFMLLGDCI